MRRILLTGNSGFIASHFQRKLESEGYKIVGYDIQDGDDILDVAKLAVVSGDVSSIWHFAAIADLNWAREFPYRTMEINIEGTYNVACVAYFNKCKLNYISTCCVYGNSETHPSDEKTLPNPSELYACTKLAGEYAVLGYHKMYGVKYNILRIPTTYGPGMRKALGAYVFLNQAMKGEPITIHGNGYQTRTLTYIDDLIEGLWLIEKNNIENELLNISTDEEINANRMARVAQEITESQSSVVYVPQRPGQTYKEQISSEKMKKLTGWEAKTAFYNGMLKTYEWMKEAGNGN